MPCHVSGGLCSDLDSAVPCIDYWVQTLVSIAPKKLYASSFSALLEDVLGNGCLYSLGVAGRVVLLHDANSKHLLLNLTLSFEYNGMLIPFNGIADVEMLICGGCAIPFLGL